MTFRTGIALGLFVTRLASAQDVGAPVAGFVLEPENRLIAVRGVLGTLLRGETVPLPSELAGAPISASFSDTSGLLKSVTAFVITDGSGQAVRTIQNEETGAALASFAADGSLRWFCAEACTTLRNPEGGTLATANGGGTVVALGASTAQTVLLLTQAGAQLWSSSLSIGDASNSHQIAVSGGLPAIGFSGGWLTTSATGVIWNPADGPATPISIPEAVLSLQACGSRVVCINGRWILNSTMQLLEIPVQPRYPAGKIKISPVMVMR